MDFALMAIAAVAGIIVAAIVVSCWRGSIVPFTVRGWYLLFVLFWVKRRLDGARLWPDRGRVEVHRARLLRQPAADRLSAASFESETRRSLMQELRHRNLRPSDNPDGEELLENLATWRRRAGRCRPRASHRHLHRRPGRCRLFVANDAWQDAVRFFLGEAKAVFLHYEQSAALDWELTQSLAARQAVVFVLLTDIPEAVALDERGRLDALPQPIRRSGLESKTTRRG